jgi:hypothetical protein
MLIVFQSLNAITIFPAMLLGLVWDVYYLRSSAGLSGSALFKRCRGWIPVRCLPLESAESLEGVRYHDYGIESMVYHRVDQLLPPHMLQGLESEFPGITGLEGKVRLTLASYLVCFDIGAVALFMGAARKYRRVAFLHTRFASYIHRISNVPDGIRLHHVFFPADDVGGLLAAIGGKIAARWSGLFRAKATAQAPSTTTEAGRESVMDTAVAFHQSIGYGKMFRKLHYFSKDSRSRLHPSKVLNLVLDRQQPLAQDGTGDELAMRDLRRVSTRAILRASAGFFLSRAAAARSLDGLLGAIFLARMHYGYRSWQVALTAYPGLKNVIIDYDILFPKTLALALEAAGIRTIALQERGSTSFASIYCAIADTYLLCGGLFTSYGQRNPSIACRQAVDFGAWRTSLLVGAEVPAFTELSMQAFGPRSVWEYGSVIAVLGWFTTRQDAESSPFLNRRSNLDLHGRVRSLAMAFPESAVVLRLKLLDEADRQMVAESFAGVPNVFLCDEYSKMNASYALCKRADVIVSVQTSLADECLAAGKKVVVLDSTHNFKKICTDIYPQEFHFAFAADTDQILDLVSRCLHGDADLAARYETLRMQLAGKFDLRTPGIIPDTLEQYLQ